AFLAKLDLQGNVLTRRLFGSGHGRNSLINGVVLADQSLVVVGYGTKAGDPDSKAMMLHISESGRVLSESFHGTGGSLFYTVAPSPDNTLFIAGTVQAKDVKKAVVFKLDPDGNEIWQTTIFDSLKDQDSEVYAIQSKGEEAILVGSAMEYGFVAKLNTTGELLWRDVYGESEKEDELAGLCLRPDGKIMVAGQTNSYASMGGQNLWVFELADKKGKLSTASSQNPDATFLAENKKKAGVITLASGSQYKILREGTGESPSYKDIVNIHYHGTFIDGHVFDSTYDRRESLEMEVEYFVKGLQELLQKMKVGCKWQLFIPADLAYGEQGRGAQIPPNKTLLYEMELLEIKGK
ncbi:MAG: FKBP-type peptidyl-prolyl cis-trans isomerase, partial [Proteobacteria bacterium]|nr:FKBP-type peptidyl-prolyl cis-trans isomerase [Pseudomonadota bacterium]